MKKLELEIEKYRNDLDEYLLSIDDMLDVKIEEKGYNFLITTTYDETKLFIERIVNEILLYIDILNTPSIVSFNKFEDNAVVKEFVISDGCCEYCMNGRIQELLEIDGINSASYDEGEAFFDATLKLSYNPDKINNEKLGQIIKEL